MAETEAKNATTSEQTRSGSPRGNSNLPEASQALRSRIDAAKQSAFQPRVVYLFLLLVSVYAFFALWNSLQMSWTNTRVLAHREARRWIGRVPDASTSANDAATFAKAKRILEHMNAPDDGTLARHLDAQIERLEKNLNDNVRILRVPIVNVSFDVNDLGLFTGVLLVIGLAMFRFSLGRELNNIRIAYDDATYIDEQYALEEPFDTADVVRRTKYRRFCYESLTMGQVLMLPPIRGDIAWYWRHLTKVAFFFPLLVQSAILANDLVTLRTGATYSAGNTVIVFMVSFAGLTGVVGLTVSSLGIWFKLERFWFREARRLQIIPGPDPLLGPGPDRDEDLEFRDYSTG